MDLRSEILTVIERNSRINIKELAVLLDSEETLIANEIQDMETEGVICGYHTLIDWSKTSGERVNALIEVKVSPREGSVLTRSRSESTNTRR